MNKKDIRNNALGTPFAGRQKPGATGGLRNAMERLGHEIKTPVVAPPSLTQRPLVRPRYPLTLKEQQWEREKQNRMNEEERRKQTAQTATNIPYQIQDNANIHPENQALAPTPRAQFVQSGEFAKINAGQSELNPRQTRQFIPQQPEPGETPMPFDRMRRALRGWKTPEPVIAPTFRKLVQRLQAEARQSMDTMSNQPPLQPPAQQPSPRRILPNDRDYSGTASKIGFTAREATLDGINIAAGVKDHKAGNHEPKRALGDVGPETDYHHLIQDVKGSKKSEGKKEPSLSGMTLTAEQMDQLMKVLSFGAFDTKMFQGMKIPEKQIMPWEYKTPKVPPLDNPSHFYIQPSNRNTWHTEGISSLNQFVSDIYKPPVEDKGKISDVDAIHQMRDDIRAAANEMKVDPRILGAILLDERKRVGFGDNFDVFSSNQLGSDASLGIGQVKVSTAMQLYEAGYYPPKSEYPEMNRDLMIALLQDPRHNTRFSAAYLRYIADQWRPHYPCIDTDAAILGTLYSQGVKKPHGNPKPNERGSEIERYAQSYFVDYAPSDSSICEK